MVVATHVVGAHAKNLVVLAQAADHAALAQADHADLLADTAATADQLAAVDLPEDIRAVVGQSADADHVLHHNPARLVTHPIHLAALQLNANRVHLVAQLSAHLAANNMCGQPRR